jgi:hypothetical protein
VQDFFEGINVTGDLVPTVGSGTSYTYGTGGRRWTVQTVVSNDPADQPDELLTCGPGQTVVNAVRVNGDDGLPLDEDQTTVTIDVQCGTACTLTQGYWKTHSAAGPKGNHASYLATQTIWKHRDATWDAIGSAPDVNPDLNENTLFFLSGQTYWEVQWTAPQGNAYYNLAHQWIAARLNIAKEASEGFGGNFGAAFATAPAQVQSAYNTALTWFQNNAPGVTPRGKAANDLRNAASVLASFNEGAYAGWPHCDENTEAVIEAYYARGG